LFDVAFILVVWVKELAVQNCPITCSL